jgi:hypothetical protein
MFEVPCPFCKNEGLVESRTYDSKKTYSKTSGLAYTYSKRRCVFCNGEGWVKEEDVDLLCTSISRIKHEYGG